MDDLVQVIDSHTFLLHAVAMTQRHGTVFEALMVDVMQ